jgi:hypothetical protein
MRKLLLLASTLALPLLLGSYLVTAQEASPQMSFFVTSAGPGNGANLGGILGADRHCQILAAQAGADPSRTWRAYLSTTGNAQQAPIHARNRIGIGPWYNAKGVMIAKDVDHLHSESNNLTRETALTESGQPVQGRGETPNRHDILTGSDPEGRAVEGQQDTTCGNWTSDGQGGAIVGHHDRAGRDESPEATSWNSSHRSQGCSQENLRATGGDGLFYCFAAN